MKPELTGDAALQRIAHDLRGPLMPLRTAAWLLRNELAESERALELAEIVDRQSARLARMMDELSDWGRFANSAALLDRAPMEAALLVDMAIAGIPGCQSEPAYGDGAAMARISADQHRFDQSLRTLIEHAMHRDNGASPAIDVSLDAGSLQIRIRDAGPALDAEARERLLDSPQKPAFDDGLGLRLLLAGSIAEAHGGRLHAESAGNAGLALVYTLPVIE
jgi:K+-sensing histidine kinase KdpD